MQLKKIQQYITWYKTFLVKTRDYTEEYKWESQTHFQENWDMEAPDFENMYDRCLQNSQTRRLWTGINFAPKEKMLLFIRTNPEFVRNMFRDLYDESKSIEGRISRFNFGCDVMLQDYKSTHPTTIENNHDHQENHMISFYLAMRFPSNYTLFFYPPFEKTMQLLGSTNVPSPFEIDRFFKIMRTLSNFLNKEDGLIDVHKRIIDKKYYREDSLLIAHDFYWQVAHHH